MQLHESECMGEYDFDHIAYFAKKRFIDCRDTIVLLAENNIVIKEGLTEVSANTPYFNLILDSAHYRNG